MYDLQHVEGEKKSNLLLYALSTCVWCKKTKNLLDELGVSYDYIFVDLADEADQGQLVEDIGRHNPAISFPTLIIDDQKCIIGYSPDEIKDILK